MQFYKNTKERKREVKEKRKIYKGGHLSTFRRIHVLWHIVFFLFHVFCLEQTHQYKENPCNSMFPYLLSVEYTEKTEDEASFTKPIERKREKSYMSVNPISFISCS
jgi:hypothetical protein